MVAENAFSVPLLVALEHAAAADVEADKMVPRDQPGKAVLLGEVEVPPVNCSFWIPVWRVFGSMMVSLVRRDAHDPVEFDLEIAGPDAIAIDVHMIASSIQDTYSMFET